jgi:hypothetical protein
MPTAKATVTGILGDLKLARASLSVSGRVVGPDGNVTGTNVMRTSGPLSIDARNVMRTIEQRGASEVGKELLTRLGWTGTATFDVHSPFERTDSYYVFLKPWNVEDREILKTTKFDGAPPLDVAARMRLRGLVPAGSVERSRSSTTAVSSTPPEPDR